ncbi:LamG-like jellyroll fold domain-containing protein [Chitinophaga niabensis]|uniref:LamG-like jellyroll fold domain-containing protein n=1 Tax=Chitinophaga niabensis TaxID=536979 RepID=UPI0031BBC2D0
MKNIYISSLGYKIIVPVFLFILTNLPATAQTVTSYSFSASNGTFTALTTPSTTTWSGSTDDAVSALIPIGFDFWYMGVHYTSVAASTNGWLSLGTVQTNDVYTNSLSSGGAPRPVIAPLWDDLDVVAFSNVTYKTTGAAGSRIFTVQYLNIKWNYQASGAVCSFQVKLHESTGRIEFVYRSDAGSANSPSGSIGITATGTGSGNFLSVNNTGNSASSTSEANITTKRTTGRTYAFTPPVPAAPGSLTFTDVTNSTMTLHWNDLSSNERGFVIYRSTDGVNYTFAAQTAANATNSAQTALSANTIYYWKVYAITEGGLSSALSGSNATSCSTPAAPSVTSPVAYCQNAVAVPLSATGTNLLWSTGTTVSGSAGGTSTLPTLTYVDGVYTDNNKKTHFTTTVSNVTITSVDCYIPPYQSVNGLVLALYNSTGTVIATSSTTLTQTASGASITKTSLFNYNIVTPGNYSIGVLSGSGVIGSDDPVFPITEPTGTINVTGVSSAGSRCFNNIQFIANAGSPTAPTPSTLKKGSTHYEVTQTVNGCVSLPATITVNVTSPGISQIPETNLISKYTFTGDANDHATNNTGTLQNAPSQTTDRFGNANRAYAFNGTSQYMSTTNAYTNPNNFTISVWFKTATTTGGKIIGFGRERIGSSGQYDRHIYMNNAGQIYFGTYGSGVTVVSSAQAYNDNKWHLATATLSATTGMILYIDGTQVGANVSVTTGEDYTGYWKLGFDNLNGWTSQPSSFYFNGSLDDVLIYNRALNSTEVAILYTSPDGAGNNGPACVGSPVSLSATTLGGATYSWSGPNGFTSSQQNPSFTYSIAGSGVYTLTVTASGCTAMAYTNVATSGSSGQWTGNVSTDWADAANWCTGTVPTAATDVIIAAGATRMPSVTSSIACNNLTVNAGATLTISAAGTLNIAGALANSGTFTNGGTVNFNGTSGQQTFSGVSSFYNLTLSNSAGLLLPGPISVSNHLTISSGTLSANGFNFTVGGNWINDAGISGLSATGTLTLNGTAAQTIGGAFATTFNNLTIANTAGVTLNTNISIKNNLSVSSGILDLGVYTANRLTEGGVLTVSNNATLKIGGTNTYPANYTINTLVVASTVSYAGTNQAIANQNYGNLTLSSSGGAAVKTFPATALSIIGNLTSVLDAGTSVTFTAASNVSVNGNVSIGASTVFNGGSYSHSIGGAWLNNGTFNGNTSTVTFTGAGKTVDGSGVQNFNNLTVAASMVTFSAGTITLSGNLATTGAGTFSQASGGTIVMTGGGSTITGEGISPDNLTISGTVSSSASLTITGNLSISGSFTGNAGTVILSGVSKTISGTGVKNFGLLTVPGSIVTDTDFSISSGIVINGSLSATAGTATFTGTSTFSGTANLYNATVNGTSLKLSANSVLGIANVLNITSGILDVTSSANNTVNFNGSGAQYINAITYENLVLSNGNSKTAVGNITVNKDITIESGTTFVPGGFTHSIYKDWINNGSFTAGTSTIQFLGPASSHIRGNTTFNILTINNSTSAIEAILESNITAAVVNMTMGKIFTDTHTLTITDTRNGSGRIRGNIQRTHSFTTGVPYAFGGQYNTVTFSSVSGVTSITVSITDTHIDDFPFGSAINQQYTVVVPSGTYNATLSLDYEETQLNGNDEAAMALWRYNGASWSSVGKTANSTTSNYVELSGITNITGRWTLSGAANLIQWNGSVSTDWNNAANWTALEGAPSAPPSASDIVNLGTASFNFQPTISTGANAKNIHFGSAQQVTLTIATGGSLTVSGNVDGTWSAPVVHTIDVNDETFTVNGDLNLSDGVNDHSIDLNVAAGTISVLGSLTESGNAGITCSGTGTLSIFKDFNHTGGIFSPGNGTVLYNGNENQDVAHLTYNHLTINKAGGIAAIRDSMDVQGNVLIMAGNLDNMDVATIAGNVTISPGALVQNTGTLHIGGNWLNSGTYSGQGSTIIFDGTGTQTISASTFNNLIVNKPVGSIARLTDSIIINGNITVTSGTFDIQVFACNRSTPGGAATLGGAGTIIIGAENAPGNFTDYVLDDSSTVIFAGIAAQTLLLPNVSFGHLIMRNGGVKTLASPVTVKGSLTIESGAVFDGGANTITLYGNWVDNGTFIPSASTVLCNGTSKNIQGNTTFNQLTVFGSYTIINDVTFNGLLNITSTGSLSGGPTIHTVLHGDLINSGTLYTLGTTTYSGNTVQTLSLINAVSTVALRVNFNGTVPPVLNSTSPPQFGYLNINNTGGINPSVNWVVLYSLVVGPGASFNGGVTTHSMLGAVTNNGKITSTGTLNFIPGTAATVNLGNDFSSTGTVVFGGAGAMTLAGVPDSFHNVIISNTNPAGITPSSAWKMKNNLTVNTGAILNAGNYVHTLGGNLTAPGVINSGTSGFTLNGTGLQEINTISAFNDLTINKTAGSTIQLSNVTVNGVLNFVAGNIATNNNLLIQPASGTITNAGQNSGWVFGRLRKHIGTGATEATFAVGDSLNYTPVSVVFSSVTTAGDLTVSTTSGDHPAIDNSTINAAKSVNRFWTLSNSGIVFTSYNVTFNYVEGDRDAGVTTNALIAGRYNDGSWTYPEIGLVTPTSTEAVGLAAFFDFQIGQLNNYVKTWDGGAGTNNWGDAANWNIDGVPTATDNVELTGAYTININVAATTNNLLLNNANLVLTTTPGNSLTVSGNFTLTDGTFNTAAAFPAISGTIDLSGGTVGFTGSGTQTIPAHNYNNLTSTSTGGRVLTASGSIGIAGAFTPGSNSYTTTGSTIDFNGNGMQTVAVFNYQNLVLSNAGEKFMSVGSTGIAGTLSITGAATINATANSSTISYNGSADQSVLNIPYYNLNAANTGGVVKLLDATINNDLSITAGTVSLGDNAVPKTITVGRNITVAGGAMLNVASTSDATHLLTVGGDVLNNGTLNLRSDANSLCNVTFNKNGNQSVSGAGAITSFNLVNINLGDNNVNYLDVAATNFSAPSGFLTLNNGSFNLNSDGVSITPFNTDITTGSFLIPATAGLWVNAGTINAANMNWTIAGLVKVTGGIMNIGSVADNVAIPKSTAIFNLSGGVLNLASRISNPGATWSMLMKGGTLNVNTLGSTTAGIAPFNMDAAGCIFDVSGGTISIQRAGGSTGQHLAYNNLSAAGPGFTDGTLQIGNASTPSGQTMIITSTNPVYNLQVNSSNVTALLQGTDLAVSNDVMVTAGTLDINGQTLQIGGDISNNGTFVANDGRIVMNGQEAQTIPAAAFTGNEIEDLTINNIEGVTLAGPLQLTGILLASNGQLHAGGNLTLVSTAAQTALIDGRGAGDVLGNVTMQRYLASGFGYKYFSSPFQAATVSEFSDDLDLGASFPTFYRYDENLVSSGWVNYVNASGVLNPGEGYAANFGTSSSPKTVDVTGVVNNNTISTTLYNHNRIYTLGFNLVGNPYPSPIDWNASSGWSRPGIDDAVYYFDNGTTDQYTGTYSSYINGISSNGIAGNVIAAMQGFFVHVSDGAFPVQATLSINNNARINNLLPDFHRPMPLTAPLLRISAGFADEGNAVDHAVVYFDADAKPVFDQEMDALKLMNTDVRVPSLYMRGTDTAKLSISAWPNVQDSTIIPLGLKIERTGWITFNTVTMERIPAGQYVYLYDVKTGIKQDLQKIPKYRLMLEAGKYENRFFLVFRTKEDVPPATPVTGTFNTYTMGGNLYADISDMQDEKCDVVITNMLGQIILRKRIFGNGRHNLGSQFTNGIFIVSFYTKQQMVSKKVFISH